MPLRAELGWMDGPEGRAMERPYKAMKDF